MPPAVSIEPHSSGVSFRVRAQPGARKNGITGVHDGQLKVSVTQAAEKGKANKALIEVLSRALGLRKSQLSLLSGETSSEKRFLVQDVSAADLTAAIAKVLAETTTG